MGTETRGVNERSRRDELEHLQEELRDVRDQSEGLSRENSELAAQVARVEEEVRSLRKARDEARDEWEKPVPSLPTSLVPPFCTAPSRRTFLGRMRFALRALEWLNLATIGFSLYLSIFSRRGPQWGFMVLGIILLWFMLRYFRSQAHEEDDERLAWLFEAEGFGQIEKDDSSRKVRYSEVRKVEVEQGWFLRLFGLGSVRVTWKPGAPTALRKDADSLNGVIDIKLLEDPHRLAEWLQKQMEEAREKELGGKHVD